MEMNRICKKWGAFLLACLLTLAALAGNVSWCVQAEESKTVTTENGIVLTYDVFTNGTVAITGNTQPISGKLVIPQRVDGKQVTKVFGIGKEDELTYVEFPEGVTGISGFNDCSKLSQVVIPSSAEYFGEFTFRNTPWFSEKQAENPLVILNTTLLDGSAVAGDVRIPDGVTKINMRAFESAKNMKTVFIPESINRIGWCAFLGCTLTDVYYSGTQEQWDAIEINNGEGCNQLFCDTPRHLQSVMFGDVNGNQGIDIDDAYNTLLAYSKISAGGESGLTTKKFSAADVDQDGVITITDAYYVLRYYAEHAAGNPITWKEMIGKDAV